MSKGTGKYGRLRMPGDPPASAESDGTAPPEAERTPTPDGGAVARTDAVVARIHAERPAPAEGKTPTYGRRADPRYVQLNANVPADLKARLKRYALEHDVTISEVIETLLADHLAE